MIQTTSLLALAAICVAALGPSKRDPVTILRTLTPGLENYHVESISQQTIKLPGNKDDQPLSVTSVTAYSYKLGAVDSTGTEAPVDLTTKVEKMEVGGPLKDLLGANKDVFLEPAVVKGKLDIRNRFTLDPKSKVDVKSMLNGTLANTIVGLFIQFSDRPVNVGEAWDMVVPKGQLTSPEDQILHAKLVDDTVVDGRPVYVISLAGSLKTDVNISKVLEDNPDPLLSLFASSKMLSKGTIDVDGKARIDKATGRTVELAMNFATTQTITFQDQTITTKGTSTMKVTADKAP